MADGAIGRGVSIAGFCGTGARPARSGVAGGLAATLGDAGVAIAVDAAGGNVGAVPAVVGSVRRGGVPGAGAAALRTVCAGGKAMGERPGVNAAMAWADAGTGAGVRITAGNAAARWACAGTALSNALPLTVALAGATMVTLVTLLMRVSLITVMLLLF